jgi:hypothetical protein
MQSVYENLTAPIKFSDVKSIFLINGDLVIVSNSGQRVVIAGGQALAKSGHSIAFQFSDCGVDIAELYTRSVSAPNPELEVVSDQVDLMVDQSRASEVGLNVNSPITVYPAGEGVIAPSSYDAGSLQQGAGSAINFSSTDTSSVVMA